MWRVPQTALHNHFNSLTLKTEVSETHVQELKMFNATREPEYVLSLGEMSDE